jgi:hypothetical protein
MKWLLEQQRLALQEKPLYLLPRPKIRVSPKAKLNGYNALDSSPL